MRFFSKVNAGNFSSIKKRIHKRKRILIEYNSFLAQKEGNLPEECEDAICANLNFDGRGKIARFAIADGASESSFAKEWAELLTTGFCEDKEFSLARLFQISNSENKKQNDETGEDVDAASEVNESSLEYLESFIKRAALKWKALVDKKKLPWYAEFKKESGAYAAFLGLEIDKKNKIARVLAVGDCCLFVFSLEKNLYLVKGFFPKKKSSDFDNTPYLICSDVNRNKDLSNAARMGRFKIEKNQVLILASDAISAWLMKNIETFKGFSESSGWGLGWRAYYDISDKKKLTKYFQDIADKARSNREMRNDDIAIVAIKINEI